MYDADAARDEPGATVTGLSLIVPSTGEVIDLEDPTVCVRVLADIRELEVRLRDAKGALTEALTQEFSRVGTKTLEINGIKATLSPDSEVVWDVGVLQELQALGLPEERMDALVTAEVTYKVNSNVAKQIAAANPAYAKVIERAKSRVPRTPYVSLRRG